MLTLNYSTYKMMNQEPIISKDGTFLPEQVGNIFLEAAKKEGKDITPMQLLKLVYIAHGWSLALFNRPLVNEPIRAWEFGPVIPSLYFLVRNYLDRPITGNLYHFVDQQEDGYKLLNALVQKVWKNYKGYNGIQLSALTHKSGTPWDKIFNSPNPGAGKNTVIPDSLIQEHYTSRLTVATPS